MNSSKTLKYSFNSVDSDSVNNKTAQYTSSFISFISDQQQDDLIHLLSQRPPNMPFRLSTIQYLTSNWRSMGIIPRLSPSRIFTLCGKSPFFQANTPSKSARYRLKSGYRKMAVEQNRVDVSAQLIRLSRLTLAAGKMS